MPSTVGDGEHKVATSPIGAVSLHLEVEPGERIKIDVESVSTEGQRGGALIEIRALARSGARVALPNWPHWSNRVAEYQYLEVADPGVIAATSIQLEIPDGVTRLELIGHQWRASTRTVIVGSPVVNRSGAGGWIYATPSGAPLEHAATYLDQFVDIPDGSREVELQIDYVARGHASSGPVAVTAFDANGTEMLPLPTLPQHAVHGPIVLLKAEPDERRTSLTAIPVPQGAVKLRVRGVDWGKRTAFICGPPRVTSTVRASVSVADFIRGIPRSEQLIVVDTTAPPMGHATLGLRPNNLALAYARTGRWVVFLPFSSLQGFGPDVAPRLRQVPRSECEALWSAIRTWRRGLDDVYICSSFPSFESLAYAHEASRLGWLVVYEVRDDMEEFNRVGYSKWYSPILEQQMLRLADRVVSVSSALDEKMATMLPTLNAHVVIPNGVRAETIEAGLPFRTIAAARSREASTTVGYVGHLTSSWFDWPLLLRAAKARPDVRFEIVGHGLPAGLELTSNVVYLGPKSHEELETIVGSWKAGLIPFRDIPLTRSVDPNKIYEYFAWGLRCITVDMGAVRDYPWTRVYGSMGEFVDHIDWALTEPVGVSDLEELEKFLRGVDWDGRAAQMIQFMSVERSR